jgi:hypothetical protein
VNQSIRAAPIEDEEIPGTAISLDSARACLSLSWLDENLAELIRKTENKDTRDKIRTSVKSDPLRILSAPGLVIHESIRWSEASRCPAHVFPAFG